MPCDTSALARRAAAGDARATAVLYERHLPIALAASRSVLRCASDAEDAAQDALLATLARLPRLDLDTLQLGAYVRVSARRTALRMLGERARFAELADDGHAASDPTPHELAERRETVRTVRSAMRRIPDRQRAALFAVAFEEREASAVGADLGLDANGVHQLVYRARRNLATALAA